MMSKEKNEVSTVTKKDLNKVYWRLQLFGIGITYNSTTSQGIGFATAMTPVLKKIYGNKSKEERVRAMQRHLEYFLSQNTATGLILGITSALEETTTEDEKEAVVAVKAGMMGPLAGIGDSVFKLTIQAIAGSIGAAYAINGNIIGVFLMFIIYNGINIAIKYMGILMGYTKGMEFITSGQQARVMKNIINFSTMVGVIVMGALISSSVKFKLGYELTVNETVVNFQTLADGVLPKILPFLITIGLYQVTKKIPRKYLVLLIIGILIVGTILAMNGVIV